MPNHPHNSVHFHDEQKGCNIRKTIAYYHKDRWGNSIPIYDIKQKCLTHNASVCRCGFEWGWHDVKDWEAKELINKYPQTVMEYIYETRS